MTTDITIKPDSGVSKPRSAGRPKDERLQTLVNKFLALKPGKESFFVEGAKRLDLEFLRKPVTEAGAGITIMETTNDEIYGVAGTRVWREAGEYDEL